MRARTDDAALRLVIAYKAVKGVVQLALGIALAVSLAVGGAAWLREWAHDFRVDSTRGYAVVLSRALEKATTPRGMHLTLAALLIDGLVTCVEAWALHHRRPWGPWLVVGVTGALLPFELVELARHVTPSRIGVLVANAAVVAFLVWHARAQAARQAPAA